jgi:hypothetical protein
MGWSTSSAYTLTNLLKVRLRSLLCIYELARTESAKDMIELASEKSMRSMNQKRHVQK